MMRDIVAGVCPFLSVFVHILCNDLVNFLILVSGFTLLDRDIYSGRVFKTRPPVAPYREPEPERRRTGRGHFAEGFVALAGVGRDSP